MHAEERRSENFNQEPIQVFIPKAKIQSPNLVKSQNSTSSLSQNNLSDYLFYLCVFCNPIIMGGGVSACNGRG